MSTETSATTTLFLEVTGIEAHVTEPKEGRPATPYVRLLGTDGRGRFARAYVWGKNAELITAQIKNSLAPGEDIGTQKPIYELEGNWRDREYTKDGKTHSARSFYTTRFGPVTGRELELNRIRRQSNKAIREAEALRADGKIEEAYRKVAELVADLGHFPLDLPEMEAELDHFPSSDEVFGEEMSTTPDAEVETAPSENPEKTAAEYYRADNKINGAPPSDPEPIMGTGENAKPEPVVAEDSEVEPGVEETSVERPASAVTEAETGPKERSDSTSEAQDEVSVAATAVASSRPAQRSGRVTRPGM